MSVAKKITLSVAGSCILAFGMYQIHSQGAVTEGGILGLTLLLYHWFHISPSLSALFLNTMCYLAGLKILEIGRASCRERV